VLIAAGFLNNILLEAGGRRILVKGRTYKEMMPADSGDPDVEVEREVLRTSVMPLDLRTGRFEVIEQGGSTATEDAASRDYIRSPRTRRHTAVGGALRTSPVSQ
jgi:hypothetical protein